MARKALKWLGIGLLVVLVLVVLFGAGAIVRGQTRFGQTYSVPDDEVPIPSDPASLARGEHLVKVLCTGCHGENLAGTDFFADDTLGRMHAFNLTTGKGGIGATYTDADFVRTLRHGVRPNGSSVFVMPARAFYYLSDADLGSIIAYLKTLPPVDQEWAPKQFTPFGNFLLGVGVFDNLIMAEQIDHAAPRPTAPAAGATAAYGDYLVHLNGCRNCHGQELSGGKVDDPTIALLAPNITPGGYLGAWSDADFIKTIRTGVNPGGRVLNEAMPWKTFAKMTDEELTAIFRYLQAQPKLATTP